MKRIALTSVLIGVTLATTAWAAEYNKTGQVGDIKLHPTWSYDEFWLTGKPNVCGSAVDSGWRDQVRISRNEPGYDSTMRALLAAKLAGATVKVTAGDDANDRCVLKHLTIVE
jgi:hypothetical protein